jgi:chemotaxis protein histidine kinase CheA
MAETQDEAPGVTKFTDHEVIVPPNRLKKAVKHSAPGDIDPVAGAEAALEQLSGEFENWMNDECARLDEARHLIHADGLSDAARQALFRAAHDIKGHAATFGFPMAAEVANSLCRLIEHSPDLSEVPLSFIDQCVDSVRAIIREHHNSNAEKTAEALARELRILADEMLHEGDAAATAPSPPLAPT